MVTLNVELEIVKQLFSTLSDDDKKLFLKSIKSKEKSKQDFTFAKEIKECPHCKSMHFKKNGTRSNGKQSFLCLDCNKSFITSNNTILYDTKKDLSVWQKYIHCMIEKYSLRKTAEICNISLPTAFAWRHKILDALQEMMNEVELNGVVQADETFMPISFKGNHKNFNLPRLAKQRGTANTKRGLSKELVCIPCRVNLDGLSIAKISNLGKPNLMALQKVLNGKISKDSVFVTDSFRAYLRLSNDMELNHIRIPRNKHSNGCSFNIQTMNSYRSILKAMLIYTFKGVATKYLNNYLAYHDFVNFAKNTKQDKEEILFNYIINTNCISKSINIANRASVPLLVA